MGHSNVGNSCTGTVPIWGVEVPSLGGVGLQWRSPGRRVSVIRRDGMGCVDSHALCRNLNRICKAELGAFREEDLRGVAFWRKGWVGG